MKGLSPHSIKLTYIVKLSSIPSVHRKGKEFSSFSKETKNLLLTTEPKDNHNHNSGFNRICWPSLNTVCEDTKPRPSRAQPTANHYSAVNDGPFGGPTGWVWDSCSVNKALSVCFCSSTSHNGLQPTPQAKSVSLFTSRALWLKSTDSGARLFISRSQL